MKTIKAEDVITPLPEDLASDQMKKVRSLAVAMVQAAIDKYGALHKLNGTEGRELLGAGAIYMWHMARAMGISHSSLCELVDNAITLHTEDDPDADAETRH